METDRRTGIGPVDLVATPPMAAAHVPERVASLLRERISAGESGPGAKLTEARLTQDFGVSRHSLRAAFQILAAEGLVERHPNRGVFVHSPTAEDVRQIYRTRRVLEIGVVSVADYDARTLDELDRIIGAARSAVAQGDGDEMAQANQEFHRRLVAQADSAVVVRAMEEVLARMRLAFSTMRDISSFHPDYVEPNARTVQLLRAGDRGEAITHMSDYFDRAEAELLDHLGQSR